MISGRTRSYATGSLTNTVNVNSDVFDLNNADNSATASTMVNAKSDIYVTIKDNPDPVIADENLTYNLTVSNQGPSDAQNVVLAGSLPLPNLEYSLDDGVTWNKWNGSINLGNLVSGNLETILIHGKVASSATGTLSGTASVTADTTDANTQNNAFSETTAVNARADLFITGNDSPDPVIAGENLTYSITISNNGPSDALNVILTGNTALESIIYSLNGGSTWNTWINPLNVGTIIVGGSKSILIRGKVPSSTIGTFTSTITVNSNTNDSNLANNVFAGSTVVNTRADISITGTDNPDPVIAGGKLIYNLTVNNQGPSDALNMVLTPNTALENIEYSLDNGNTWIGSLNIGTTITGGSKTVLIRGKVPSSALGSFTSTFTVNSSTNDPNLVNNAFTESTSVNTRADLSVTMIDNRDPVSAGEELTYTINVSNLGPSDARNAILSDTFPSQLQNVQYSLGNGTTWGNWTGSLNLGTLSVNGSRSVLIKGKIPSSTLDGLITNTASVSSDTLDLNTANNVCSESTTVNTRADLAITINAGTTSLHVGDTVKLTLTVKNNGPSDATGVKTTYYIPNGFKHISISSNSYNPFTGLWNIGNLNSGSIVYLNVSGKVENVGLINNTAVVSGNQTDPNMTNNNARLLLSVYPNPWGHWNPLNSGNGNSNDDSNGNHYGNSGGGSGSGSGGSTQNGNGNHYGNYGDNGNLGNGQINTGSGNYNEFSIFGPFTPYLMGNDNPLSGLARDSNEAWKYNNKGSVYGPFAGILNSPFNPFGFQFYTWDKLIQAGQKAWQTGNIWDFFDYTFYHIPGYSSFLNKVWGGENIKWFLDNFFGIDPDGNMSVGYFLLNLATIIPIGRVASIGGKLLVRFLPKAAYLMKSPAVQFLLKNRSVNTILGLIGKYSNSLKKGIGTILNKIPKYLRNIKLDDIVKGIRKISDLINMTPKTWIETIVKGLSKSSWISRNGSKLVTTVFDKLKLWRKVLPEEIPTIIADGIKIIWQGAKGGFGSLLNIFSDMTPLAVKEWVHTTPWRMRTFRGLKKLTSTHLYKDVQGVVSPLIKKNAALHSVYKAAKKVNEAAKKIPETAKIVVKTAANVIKTVAKTAKTVAKKVISKVTKTVKKVSTKIVTSVKKIVKKVSKTVNKAVKTVKNTISSGVNWLKSRIGW